MKRRCTLDKNIHDTIIECQDNFSSGKMIRILYYKLFGEWPYDNYAIFDDDIILNSRPYNISPVDEHDSVNIDLDAFHESILKLGYDRISLDYDNVYINIYKRIIFLLGTDYISCYGNYIDENDLIEIQKCIEVLEIDDNKINVGILVNKNGNYYVDDTEIDKINIDIDKTYNNDIPLDAIENFVDEERNGLALFYGEPGTGKSTFIRWLMQEYNDKNFIILDSNLLYNISSSSLLNTFIDQKNAIYVIEDCEKLLVSRDDETNPIISAFLNMTDGILANIINCKFICTFNTDLSNIDNALKRKGRMKFKYEFKKLSSDKVKNILGDNYNTDMTIADVVYNEKQNDFSKKIKNKIGFN